MSWSQTPVAVWDMVSAALVAAGYHVTLMPTVGQDVSTLLDKSLILDMNVSLGSRVSDATTYRQATEIVELRITHVWYKPACSLAEAVADMWDRESEIHVALAALAVARSSTNAGLDHVRSETPRQLSPGLVAQTMTYQCTITRGSA